MYIHNIVGVLHGFTFFPSWPRGTRSGKLVYLPFMKACLSMQPHLFHQQSDDRQLVYSMFVDSYLKWLVH